ncbi:MAG TPA: hypothetical protein PKN32_08240 [Bacteroidales bacterium]|nr:hypothetical protein [Bacteroidales bacterium]
MALLNTHATVKKFMQHGFSEEQAEVVVDAINDQSNHLVTKQDLAIAVSELKSDIAELKTNIKWIMAIGLLIVGILLKNTFI